MQRIQMLKLKILVLLFSYFIILFYQLYYITKQKTDKSRFLPQLRAVRELRTIILSGWKSYELDAAVDMLEGKLPL